MRASAASWADARLAYVTNANRVPSAATRSSRATSTNEPRSQSGKKVSPSKSASISVSTSSSARGRAAAKMLAAADDEDVLRLGEQLERLLERAGSLGSLRTPVGLRVTTTFRRPGSGRKRSGSDSQVRRPITTGWPIVTLAEMRQVLGQVPRKPAVATDHAAARRPRRRGRPSHGDRRADRRMVLVPDDLEVLERVVEDRGGRRRRRSVGYGNGSRASSVSTCSRWLS